MVIDKINFNLRITEELNEELIKIAAEEGRSKNSQIEYILKEYVKQYKNKKDKNNRIIEQHNNETSIGENNGNVTININRRNSMLIMHSDFDWILVVLGIAIYISAHIFIPRIISKKRKGGN